MAAAATPTFSPVAGSYAAPQAVTISSTSPGVTIYYTKDGSTPTTSSSQYIGPVIISATGTLKAIAIGGGFTISPTGSAAYTITGGLSTKRQTWVGSERDFTAMRGLR